MILMPTSYSPSSGESLGNTLGVCFIASKNPLLDSKLDDDNEEESKNGKRMEKQKIGSVGASQSLKSPFCVPTLW